MARKTWFITGASSGFGLAFARYALAQGHNVVATARRLDALEELATQAPDRVLALALDVTNPDSSAPALRAPACATCR
jgi:NADP-dependent 3-hydroxy acid dehydrogenase YdfG